MTENTGKRIAPEVRARAVRMVFEHQRDPATQWAAIGSIASKIGCSAETLRNWVRQAERDCPGRAHHFYLISLGPEFAIEPVKSQLQSQSLTSQPVGYAAIQPIYALRSSGSALACRPRVVVLYE
jgi:transposase-like protein